MSEIGYIPDVPFVINLFCNFNLSDFTSGKLLTSLFMFSDGINGCGIVYNEDCLHDHNMTPFWTGNIDENNNWVITPTCHCILNNNKVTWFRDNENKEILAPEGGFSMSTIMPNNSIKLFLGIFDSDVLDLRCLLMYCFYFFRVKHNNELISEIVPQENETTFRLYDTVRNITIYEKEK